MVSHNSHYDDDDNYDNHGNEDDKMLPKQEYKAVLVRWSAMTNTAMMTRMTMVMMTTKCYWSKKT